MIAAAAAAALLLAPAAAAAPVVHEAHALEGPAGARSPPVVPTEAVLRWQLNDTGCFVHYNMATMAGLQGCQDGVTAPPALAAWQPTALDTDAWVSTCKAMGGTRMIYVAKHGCGFAAWKSKTTYNYSVTQAPDQIDVVAAFVKSARAAGLGVGFYYSDATNSYCHVSGGVVQPGKIVPGRQIAVTQAEYDAIVLAHLAELWGNYGALDELWFDGGYYPPLKAPLTDLITKLQPNAVVLGGYGLAPSTARWVGTESGLAPYPSWSRTSCTWNEPPKCKTAAEAGRGSPDGAFWCPAETDFTLQRRDQWFYNGQSGVHPPAELRLMYEQSAGSNTGLIIDIAPYPNGSVPAEQVAAAAALGKFKRGCYGGTPVASSSGAGTIKPSQSGGASVDRVQVREDLANGQNVRNFTLVAKLANGGGSAVPLCPDRGGSSIGSKYICVLKAPIKVESLTLTVTAAVGGGSTEAAKITQFAAFSCDALAREIDAEWAASAFANQHGPE